MSFLGYFVFLVAAVSLSELWLLIRVSEAISFLPTLGLCLLTAIIGGALVRYQGLQTILRFQQNVASGRVPAEEIMEGIVLLVVGALLCVPGFITDTFGFLMLIPPLRRKAISKARSKLSPRIKFESNVWHHYTNPADPSEQKDRTVIDAEYEEESDAQNGKDFPDRQA